MRDLLALFGEVQPGSEVIGSALGAELGPHARQELDSFHRAGDDVIRTQVECAGALCRAEGGEHQDADGLGDRRAFQLHYRLRPATSGRAGIEHNDIGVRLACGLESLRAGFRGKDVVPGSLQIGFEPGA